MSILVALWLTLKAPGRNWQMRANCKMASSLLSAPRQLRLAWLKPWIGSVLAAPFYVPVPQRNPHICLSEKEKKLEVVGVTCVVFIPPWGTFTFWNLLIWGPIDLFYRRSPTSSFLEQHHVRQSQKGKDAWHMSAWRRVGGYAEWTGKRGQQGRGGGGLAAAPHLPRVSGCGQHPITHPYHFAKPAPLSLDMWHEGHSAKWNLQVTHCFVLLQVTSGRPGDRAQLFLSALTDLSWTLYWGLYWYSHSPFTWLHFLVT